MILDCEQCNGTGECKPGIRCPCREEDDEAGERRKQMSLCLQPRIDMRGRNVETERLRKIGMVRRFEKFTIPIDATFTNWTVIETGLMHPDGKKLSPACKVRCVCGKVAIIKRRKLTSGWSRSCGCFKRGLKVEDSHWKKVYASIRCNAKNRSICCEFLTYNRFRFISQLPCAYCGCDPENTVTVSVTTYDDNGGRLGRLKGNPRNYSGIDRVDSSKNYEKGNMLPCCVTCNRAKNVQPLETFLLYLARHGSTLKAESILAQAKLLGEHLEALDGGANANHG